MVIKNDTLVLITPAQAKIINLTKVNHDRYRDLVNNLEIQQKQTELILVNRDTVIASLGQDITRYKAINVTNDAMQASFQRELTELQKQVKRLKVNNGLLGTIAAGLAAVVVYLSIK